MSTELLSLQITNFEVHKISASKTLPWRLPCGNFLSKKYHIYCRPLYIQVIIPNDMKVVCVTPILKKCETSDPLTVHTYHHQHFIVKLQSNP